MAVKIDISGLPVNALRRAFASTKVQKVVCIVCEERKPGDYLDAWLSQMSLNGKAEVNYATSPETALAMAMNEENDIVRIFWFKATQTHLIYNENSGKPGTEHFCFSQRHKVNGGPKKMVWFGGVSEHSADLIRGCLFD